MEYKKFGDAYLVRIDRSEELIENLEKFAKEENIKLASISGIGACDDVTVGVYSIEEQKYYSNNFTGEMELTSISGNFSTMDGKPYLHAHATFARQDGSVVGGHLNEAHISATSEIIVHLVQGQIDREKDEEVTGLNLIKFDGNQS